jgi:hypothetical protein
VFDLRAADQRVAPRAYASRWFSVNRTTDQFIFRPGLTTGWGIFDVVEGLIDYKILGIHHVREDLGGPCPGTLAFSSSESRWF